MRPEPVELEPGEQESLEGLVARTVELVVRADSLAERMRAGADSPTLSAHLATLEEAVSRGQGYLRQLVEDGVAADGGPGPRPRRR